MLDRFHSGGGRAEDIPWSANWPKEYARQDVFARSATPPPLPNDQ